MFESTPISPPDAVFGLNEEFKQDPNPEKINLTVGMYQDETGQTPIMGCVHRAEQLMLERAIHHGYLPIAGLSSYNQFIPRLIFGESHNVIAEKRVHTVQTPGGTGALRVAGELLRRIYSVKRIWMSDPSWANHPKIFAAAELEVGRYDYLDEAGLAMDFQRVIDSVSSIPHGDAILLHTVCHNPTGVDPSSTQWAELLNVVRDRGLIPIFDFAYQGFGEGLEEDPAPLRAFCDAGGEALICNSFSKNFNLYGERVGGLTAVAADQGTADAMLSQIKSIVRTIYSNPPMHGAMIVATVLADDTLRQQWQEELEKIRLRIGDLRQQFVTAMSKRSTGFSFEHIATQRGMFSYSGIRGEQADRLKNEFSVYLLRSGRINIAGISPANLDRLCDAIAAVL